MFDRFSIMPPKNKLFQVAVVLYKYYAVFPSPSTPQTSDVENNRMTFAASDALLTSQSPN